MRRRWKILTLVAVVIIIVFCVQQYRSHKEHELCNALCEEFDVNEIHSLIKEAENIEFDLNLRLYELLEDTSYLETAYNQVQEKADNLEPDVAAKFLSYPIPAVIVEEWEKVK